MRTCTYQCFASCADALTNCANGAMYSNDSTSNISYNVCTMCTALEKMLLIKNTNFFADIKCHRKDIDKYLPKQINISFVNLITLYQIILAVLTLLEGHDHMSKIIDVEVSAFSECFLLYYYSYYNTDQSESGETFQHQLINISSPGDPCYTVKPSLVSVFLYSKNEN